MDKISPDEFDKVFAYYETLGYRWYERYRRYALETPNGWEYECVSFEEILDAARDFEAHYKFSRKSSGVDQQMNEETNTDD